MLPNHIHYHNYAFELEASLLAMYVSNFTLYMSPDVTDDAVGTV